MWTWDQFDLINMQADEQCQKLGQIGQGLDMIVRFIEEGVVKREQEMREQETEHEELYERDWGQKVIDKETLDYLAQNR